MTVDLQTPLLNSHEDVWEVLPWYVNGTLNDQNRNIVKAHLLTCTRCQNELESCQNLIAAVHRDREASWQSSPDQLNRLLDQIDQKESAEPVVLSDMSRGLRLWVRRLGSWCSERFNVHSLSMAIPVALVFAAIGTLIFNLMLTNPTSNQDAQFETLTSVAESGDAIHPRLQIIFSDDATATQITQLLTSIKARITDGPTEVGQYTLTLSSDPTVNLSQITRDLRIHPAVNFAQVKN